VCASTRSLPLPSRAKFKGSAKNIERRSLCQRRRLRNVRARKSHPRTQTVRLNPDGGGAAYRQTAGGREFPQHRHRCLQQGQGILKITTFSPQAIIVNLNNFSSQKVVHFRIEIFLFYEFKSSL